MLPSSNAKLQIKCYHEMGPTAFQLRAKEVEFLEKMGRTADSSTLLLENI